MFYDYHYLLLLFIVIIGIYFWPCGGRRALYVLLTVETSCVPLPSAWQGVGDDSVGSQRTSCYYEGGPGRLVAVEGKHPSCKPSGAAVEGRWCK